MAICGTQSVEAASLPWSILIFTGEGRDTSAWKVFDGFLKTSRLGHLEPLMARREWLAGTFSVADILMADVLRLVESVSMASTYPALSWTMSPAPRLARPS